MNTSHPAYPITPSTYGPAFDLELDGQRLRTQLEVIAALMERANQADRWLTLMEIEEATGYPQSSISAQLRHLRKKKFGEHIVEKRRRNGKGTFEYRVTA